MSASDNKLSDLPFVRESAGSVDFWAVVPSGDWSQDNAQGREHADACAAYMRETHNAGVLGGVVRSMIAAGRYEGVEVGFMTRIATLGFTTS